MTDAEKRLEEFDTEMGTGVFSPASVTSKLYYKKFLITKIAQARAEERERVRKIIKESRWECYEHGLPKYEKTDCVECNSALETNVVLEALLSSLDKSVNIKD